jgi:DNA-binding transcriptional ArsR family regulator
MRTMLSHHRIAEMAALPADPSRAAMLSALWDGRALPAGELTRAAGVSAATASAHLRRLLAILRNPIDPPRLAEAVAKARARVGR